MFSGKSCLGSGYFPGGGTSGTSGGISGTSGGINGNSGISGISGTSGGISGGINGGISGNSGISGISGTSGGISGYFHSIGWICARNRCYERGSQRCECQITFDLIFDGQFKYR